VHRHVFGRYAISFVKQFCELLCGNTSVPAYGFYPYRRDWIVWIDINALVLWLDQEIDTLGPLSNYPAVSPQYRR
jgi:hypothetical protein